MLAPAQFYDYCSTSVVAPRNEAKYTVETHK